MSPKKAKGKASDDADEQPTKKPKSESPVAKKPAATKGPKKIDIKIWGKPKDTKQKPAKTDEKDADEESDEPDDLEGKPERDVKKPDLKSK